MIKMGRVTLFEAFGLQREATEVRELSYGQLPPSPRSALERIYAAWYRQRIQAASKGGSKVIGKAMVGDTEDPEFASAVVKHAQENLVSIKDGSFGKRIDGRWFTDGDVIVRLVFDDRVVDLSSDLDRKLDDADIFFWDGHSWKGNDERMRTAGLGPLSQEDDATVRALVSGAKLGPNPHAAPLKAALTRGRMRKGQA